MAGYSSREIGQTIIDLLHKNDGDRSRVTPDIVAKFLNEIAQLSTVGGPPLTDADEVRIMAFDDPRVSWVKTDPLWKKKPFDAEAEARKLRAAQPPPSHSSAVVGKNGGSGGPKAPEFTCIPVGCLRVKAGYPDLEKYRWLSIIQHAIMAKHTQGRNSTCAVVDIVNEHRVRDYVVKSLKSSGYTVETVIGGRENDTSGASCVIFRVSWA